MRYFSQFAWGALIVLLVVIQGCALIPEEKPEKSPPIGLIVTPPSYYSTQKARYLGYKYQENLSRLIEKIVRDPKTSNLQFANNIASVGGIGFFTHSAAKTPDERYLEVVLAAPETFEKKGDYSSKINRLFSLYGSELLTILSSDGEMYQEKQLAGYGLDLSWRTITSEASGPRVVIERAIAYFPKEKVRAFLKKEIVENNLLRDAVIFASEADGPLSLVSYRQKERKPDLRPPIQEEVLAENRIKARKESKSVARKPEARGKTDKRTEGPANEAMTGIGQREVASKPLAPKVETKVVTGKGEKDSAAISAALKDNVGREAAPEKNPGQAPIVQKSAASVSKTAERKDAKPTPPTAARGAPAGEAALANTLPHSPSIQAKTTEVGPQEIAKIEAPRAVSQKTEKVERAKELPIPMPRERKASAATGETHAVGMNRSSPAVRNKPPVEKKPGGTGSEPAANVRETGEVHSLQAASKADVKPIEKKIARLPPVVTLPKATQAGLAPLESSRQAKPGQTQSVPPLTAKKEVREDRQQSSTPIKSVDKSPSVAGPTPGRATAYVDSGDIAKQKLKEKVEAKIQAPAGGAKTAPKPKTEPQSIIKERVEPFPSAVARAEKPIAQKTVAVPAPPVTPPKHVGPLPEKDKHSEQELALLTNKPSPDEGKPAVRAAPKMLKGYIIQIAFMDEAKAQHWAETLERRGYAVSVTKAGGSGSLRVRFGNFPMRHEAERELKSLAKNGLNGIVLNLPDGYRPVDGASNGD